MKHDIIITSEQFEYLQECRQVVEKIEKDEKFIHVKVYYAMGTITSVSSNDERLEKIKTSYEQELRIRSEQIRILQKENEQLKSRGFFKRLFS